MIILFILGITVIAVLVAWFVCFMYVNDLSVPTKQTPKAKRALVIFPHADDEGLNAGGFLTLLVRDADDMRWVILTQGEKGTPDGTLKEALRTIRTNEARTVASIFRIPPPIQRAYPDGGVAEHTAELKTEIQSLLKDYQPDLVLTYDLAGMYGHSDHIAVAEIVTELTAAHPATHLWYVSYPKRQIDAMTLPERMAKDPAFKSRRVYPTCKVWVGVPGVINKIRAVYAYKSQRASYRDSFPIRWVPMWFYASLTLFEYYHEVR